jgi:hypothetical protein
MKRHIKGFGEALNEAMEETTGGTVTFELPIVIDQGDQEFYQEVLPALFMSMENNNVTMEIVTWHGPSGGNPQILLKGSQVDIESVIMDSMHPADVVELVDMLYGEERLGHARRRERDQ